MHKREVGIAKLLLTPQELSWVLVGPWTSTREVAPTQLKLGLMWMSFKFYLKSVYI